LSASTFDLVDLLDYCGLSCSNFFAYVINQSHEHWLLSDALHIIISMNLKLKEKNQVSFSFENIMDDDSIVANDLVLLASTSKGRFVVCWILSFHS
jgi:hypothetical protein